MASGPGRGALLDVAALRVDEAVLFFLRPQLLAIKQVQRTSQYTAEGELRRGNINY
ncbi:MAG TPA: hypothetical protein VJ728_00425 [Candidatus Binataceae bacterium]|nr:hypothetical protein [Candidatus Binataceae bacterium]